MSGLRVCMVTTFYPPYNFGGDGIGIQRLARALAGRGNDVTVVHDVDAFEALSKRPAAAAPAEPEGVHVVGLRSRLGVLNPLLTQQTGRPVVNGARIGRILDRGDFDVTMFHNVSLVGGPGVLKAGRGITLYEAHEHWLVCAAHVLWRHDSEPCTGRQCLRCVLHYRRPPQLWRYTGYLDRQLEHVDAFIAKSAFSRDKHQEFGFERPMRVIPYFLPSTAQDGPRPTPSSEPPHDRPYFLFVGRLEKIKGLDDVIPAFRRYPDADLLIAGDGEHGNALERLAAGVANVRFLGRLPAERLREFYEHAIALIVPSLGFETFGIILIEAFRQGTPVIVRRRGPFPEIVQACDGGLLFEDADELLAAMGALQRDADLRARLGQSAYAGFLEHWTEDAVVPQYIDLIREIAERKGNNRVLERMMTESTA